MAEVHVAVEAARSAAEHAVSAADHRERGWERAAHVARVWCAEALQHATAEMIQLHGGIAITWEHDAHLYFKRAHSSAQLLGRPDEHVRLLAGGEPTRNPPIMPT
jgi:alkylation response protein AidB-like acyl-CoA dehydrogenase